MKISDLSAIVYEVITGKCWHGWTPQAKFPYWTCVCISCGINYIGTVNDTWPVEPPRCASDNPDLINSLDAWPKIWDCMTREQLWEHSLLLAQSKMPTCDNIPDDALVTFNMGDCDESDDKTLCIEVRFGHHFFRATPLHHLEAALRMLGKWTPEMEQVIKEVEG